MKKQHIWIVVGLMATAMLGLVFLQYNWIKDSIATREAEFDHQVQHALQKVDEKLKKIEGARFLRGNFYFSATQNKNIPTSPNTSTNSKQTTQPSTVTTTLYTFDMDCQVYDVTSQNFEPATKHRPNNPGYSLPTNDSIIDNKAFLGILLGHSADGNGIPIEEVLANGPADQAGLRPGDLITGINGQEVKSQEDVLKQLGQYDPRQDITISYRRIKHIAQANNDPRHTPRNGQAPHKNGNYPNSPSILLEDMRIIEQMVDQIAFASLAEMEEVQRQRMRQQMYRQADFFSRLAFEMTLSEVPVDQRISHEVLDTTLRHTLQDAGLDLNYQYCLRSDYDCVLYSNTADISNDLLTTNYRKNIYQDEINSPPGELLLYFPQRKRYVLGASGLMLGSSVFFNLIILLTFSYTLRTVIRQKKLSDMKTDFINNMTHELKTPISTIKLVCEMLTDQGLPKTEKSLNRYAHIIQDENARLQNHVEKVLQFARLEKGSLKLKMDQVDMHQLIEKAIQKTKLQIDKQEGELKSYLHASQTIVEGDALHLLNIISNLLDNAVKYSKEIPEITIYSRSTEEMITIAIQDRGIGMNKEALKRVFDKFYRVSTGNIHDVKGFGLGLSYVKLMVEAHGGTVSAVSKPNKGSTFEFSLPIAMKA